MLGQMVPCGGGQAIALARPTLVVGRTPECDVTLPFGTISSKHCRLDLREGAWHVTDLGSRNGIKIDGRKCPAGPLAPGCVLSVAQHRFQIDYVTNGRASAPARPPAHTIPAASRRPVDADTTVVSPLPAPTGPAPAAGRAADSRRGSSLGAPLGELIPCGGGVPIPLLKSKLLVGRLSTCDIPLASSLVSAKHCELEFKEGFWHVRDLGSRNGIRVGGECYLAKYLRPGEILTIAKLRFEVAYTPQSDEPPSEENPFALSLMEKAGLARRGEPAAADQPSPADADKDRKKRWTIE
ncbi:MAG: FHA domain-containing protein [Planctomycetaceae bacterium]|nr:FHA domain-containing protein [Planctomycetaceae bacterium]